MVKDRPLLGVGLMLGFCIIAPIGDATAKALGQHLPVSVMVAGRFGLQTLFLLPLALLLGLPMRFGQAMLWRILLRTVLHITGIGAMFTALFYLPLADAIAIAFVMPFFMLLLGKFVLGEEVGARRLGACIAGFAGTLMVIQPSFAEVGPAALLPLLVAISFALFMLVTRQIAKEVDAVALQAVSGAMATVLLLPGLWLLQGSGIENFAPRMPSAAQWGVLAFMGALGTLAHLFMTWSLRFAPSATLAPMQYLEIPVATLVGWLVFSELPGGRAAIGIAITVASGLYIIWRETRLSRAPIPPSPPAS